MSILTIKVNLAQTKLTHFQPAELIALNIEYHPIQNVILISLDKDFFAEQIKQITMAARSEIVSNHKKSIADDDLSFDVIVREKNEKISRFILTPASAETAEFLPSDGDFYTIKFNPDLSKNSSTHKIETLTPIMLEDPAFLEKTEHLLLGNLKEEVYKALQKESISPESTDIDSVLKDTNYPHFIKAWLPYFEEPEDLHKFLKQLLSVTSKLLYCTSAEGEIIGALGLSTSEDFKVNYLSFFVVDKSHRGHVLSAELIAAAINEIPPHLRDQAVYTFYTDQAFMVSMLERIGVSPDQARLTGSINVDAIPVVESLTLKTTPQYK